MMKCFRCDKEKECVWNLDEDSFVELLCLDCMKKRGDKVGK